SVELVKASTVVTFGDNIEPPEGACVHFQGADATRGPMIQYTLVTGMLRQTTGWTSTSRSTTRGSPESSLRRKRPACNAPLCSSSTGGAAVSGGTSRRRDGSCS